MNLPVIQPGQREFDAMQAAKDLHEMKGGDPDDVEKVVKTDDGWNVLLKTERKRHQLRHFDRPNGNSGPLRNLKSLISRLFRPKST